MRAFGRVVFPSVEHACSSGQVQVESAFKTSRSSAGQVRGKMSGLSTGRVGSSAGPVRGKTPGSIAGQVRVKTSGSIRVKCALERPG